MPTWPNTSRMASTTMLEPGPHDLIHRRYRFGAVGQGANGSRAADLIDLIDAGDLRCRQHHCAPPGIPA